MFRTLTKFAALSFAFGAGCASSPTTDAKPAIVKEMQPGGFVIELQVTLTNPNTEPLPLREVEYTVELPGISGAVFRGVRSAEGTLPAGGTHTLLLPASFATNSNVIGESYRISGSVGYLSPGQVAAVLYDYRVVRPSVSFTSAGTVQTGDVRSATGTGGKLP